MDSNFEANKEANTWIQKYIYQHDIYSHYVSRPVVVATNGNAACALFYQKDPHFSLVFKGFDRLDTTWDYYVAYCNQIPATQLRNGTWPPDSAIHLMTFEQKPMVAFYRNEARFREWNLQDSLARVADSLQHIADSLSLMESKKE